MRQSIEFSAFGHRIKIIGGPDDNFLMASALRDLADTMLVDGVPFIETDLDKPNEFDNKRFEGE